MKKLKHILLILMLVPIFKGQAQDRKTKKANEEFENYAFMDAIASYEDLVGEGFTDEEIFKKLGNANYVNARYREASEWYAKLVGLENTTIEPDYFYRYAQSLKSLGDYKGADKWLKKFQMEKSNDQRARNYADRENYLERIEKNSGRYTLKNLSANSAVSDFAPSFHDKALVFSTARDSGITSRNIHQWNEGSFLNLHVAPIMEDGELGAPKRFSKKLNTKTHESSSVFTKDGKTVYFTRNNSQNGRFSRDGKGVSRLKIYQSTLEDGQWGNAVELPFNSDDRSVAHPALSSDGKTLYFSSDMSGSLGASDLFKVAINDDGSFGVPQNLGATINTEARETFPFIEGDILYFSSDGHPGLGGLDVFAVKLDGSSNEVINLGKPLNGTQDDFSYIINGGQGYFASNREGGMGSDDIYHFKENTPLNFPCASVVNGIVKDRESGEPLPLAMVVLMDGQNIIGETTADQKGLFAFEVDCNKNGYTLTGNKEAYQRSANDLNIVKGKPTDVELVLDKVKIPEATVGTNLLEFLKLPPVYFDLDKSEIRPDARASLDKLADYLNEFQDMKVEIQSHTDAKAGTSYNKRLSDRRARATKDYLVSKGINAERLSNKGYGESELVNDCLDWQKCDGRQNEMNRRSEFMVIK